MQGEASQELAGAVEALQAIYDRYHLDGDGGAGQMSGDALRALGIDPDLGGGLRVLVVPLDAVLEVLRTHYRENTVCSDFAKAIDVLEQEFGS